MNCWKKCPYGKVDSERDKIDKILEWSIRSASIGVESCAARLHFHSGSASALLGNEAGLSAADEAKSDMIRLVDSHKALNEEVKAYARIQFAARMWHTRGIKRRKRLARKVKQHIYATFGLLIAGTKQ